MYVRNWLMLALALFVVLPLLPARVSACACCADPGEYRISFSNPSEYQLGVVDRLRFGATANLFTTEMGIEENGKGIFDASDNYALGGSLAGKIWRLTFRHGNKQGTLILSLPAKMFSFRADIRESMRDINVWLYKEWRFEGLVKGTGIFQAGIVGPTRYRLVFQGRGNSCDDESNFTHWHLEIMGKRASYAFYGEIKQEAEVTKHAKGTFEVKINPQAPEENVGDATIGRMALDKQFQGDLEGTSKGQMLTFMTDVQGSAGYVAIERVNGTLDGHKGTFALQHSGTMNRGEQQLSLSVVPDSGTGDLAGLSGKMTIEIVDGKHFYDFEYTIATHG